MKIVLMVAGSVLALLAFLLLALLLVFPSDEVEKEFSTYDAAVAAGAIERQWLPTLLPRSATKIWSVRNLDLNYEVVTFKYGPDFQQFIAAQEKAPAQSAKSLGIRLRDDDFTNPHELIYMPKVSFYEESKPGSLLVNHVHGVALYFD